MKSVLVIPAAGSLGLEYNQWKEYIPDDTQFYVVQYPGRGVKVMERSAQTFDELIDISYKQVKEHITGDDYILVGHSMGSYIAYEVYYKLVSDQLRLPKAVCFTGCNAPCHEMHKNLSSLSDSEFRKKFIDLGGISPVFLTSLEMTEMLFVALRRDINILESYQYIDRSEAFKSDVYVMYGDRDNIVVSGEEWNKSVKTKVVYMRYDGGHFFIFEHMKEIIKKLIEIF